jgi:putative redox protein
MATLVVKNPTTIESKPNELVQTITIGSHKLLVDEPVSVGGANLGPNPHELLLAALGSCKSLTCIMYARHKGWPLEKVKVEMALEAEGEKRFYKIKLHFEGNLDDAQKARLLEISERCPVHRTLTSTPEFFTELF